MIAKNLTSGTYTFYAFATDNVHSCDAKSEPFTVEVWNNPTIIVTPNNSEVCKGESTNVSARLQTGNGSFTWTYNGRTENGEKINVTIQDTTTIHVSGTDENGCSSETDTTIRVLPIPTLTIEGEKTICEGNTNGVQIQLSGAKKYSVENVGDYTSNSENDKVNVTLKPESTKDYNITGVLNGCTNTESVTITVNPLPDVRINGETNGSGAICEGDSIVLGATKGLTGYTWTVSNFTGTKKYNTVGDSLVIKTDATTTHQLQTINVTLKATGNNCEDSTT